MRRTAVLVLGVAMAFGVASCGDSDGSSAGDLDLTEVLAKVKAGGVECDGKVGPYVPAEDELDFGIDIAESFKCTIDGTEVEASSFKSPADVKVALAAIESLGCGFGMGEFSYVSEGPWMIAAQVPEDDDKADEQLTKQIADALDTDVDRIVCDESEAGDDNSSDADDESTTTLLDSSELVPADEAERNDATKADLDEFVDAGDGLFLKVSAITVDGDDEPWLALEARAENRGGEDVSIPEFSAICGGATEGDGWMAGSTFPMYDEVKAGSFAEGTLELLPTGNGRVGDPIERCDAPAVIRISADDGNVDIEVPGDVLDAYNAAAGN